ncbi:MAG: AMP-binding protein [Actinomycetia bacterium]|nr:AMP-binding protein [Actinomycetes bacterium]
MTRTWTYAEVCAALASPQAAAGEAMVHVGTSGSTGTPKIARLTAHALTASARATLEVLGGPGQWLLATPATHIAGIQVLVRSAVAGIEPVVGAPGPFTPAQFAQDTASLSHERRYCALVPTQVARLLDDPDGRAALATYDAVLVGGAPIAPALREDAAAAGARLIATYGMSETAGGCVYDGVPLPVARMRIADPDEHGVGVVELGGATLAEGYADRPEQTRAAFRTEPDGSRWFRSDDLGRIEDGVLSVLGRRDDVINSGGLKVSPHVVEAAVAEAFPDLAGRSVVIATPHPQWGEAVTLVVAGSPPPELDVVREAVSAYLVRAALPTRVVATDQIPLLGPGKADRRTLRAQICRK